eukprot:gb/GFBE01055656.1/.p1 GENE.gb/GFBE01055656.1/~~gb/GFBE01055656.1/.p1  ORF type:complete len:217 (+),score=37.79 gb/GFBE01055656.1/:1-651(+)
MRWICTAGCLLLCVVAKPVSLLNHSLVDHLQQGRHLFVLFSRGRFDQPDAHHHVKAARAAKAGERRAAGDRGRAATAFAGGKDDRSRKELDDMHREVERHRADRPKAGEEKSSKDADRLQREAREEGKTWEELSKFYLNDPLVLIGYLNCDHSPEEARMCKEHSVTKYPTLVHYKGDEWSTPGVHQHYEGKRDLESLKDFVESYVRQPPKSAHLEL